MLLLLPPHKEGQIDAQQLQNPLFPFEEEVLAGRPTPILGIVCFVFKTLSDSRAAPWANWFILLIGGLGYAPVLILLTPISWIYYIAFGAKSFPKFANRGFPAFNDPLFICPKDCIWF